MRARSALLALLLLSAVACRHKKHVVAPADLPPPSAAPATSSAAPAPTPVVTATATATMQGSVGVAPVPSVPSLRKP